MQRIFATVLLSLALWLLPDWWRAYTPFHLKRDLLLVVLELTALSAGAWAGALRLHPQTSGQTRGRLSREAWGLGLLLLAVSLATFAHMSRFFFIAWGFSLESLRALTRSGPAQLIVLSSVLAATLTRWDARRWLTPALGLLLVATQAACAVVLWRTTGGLAVYSDDHPSFLFRLAEFWGSFPWRENYVPYWNAGVVNSVLVSSGTTGYAWLAAPLWWLFPPHAVHTPALILVFVVLIPWITVWALRTVGLGRAGALAGGLLALSTDRNYHVWLLHFGTVGAALSWSMVPAAFAFLHAVAVQRRATPLAFLGLAFTMFFAAQWPPTLMVCAGFGVLALASVGRWWKTRAGGHLLGAGLLVGLLLAHSVVAVLGGKDLLGYTLGNAARPHGWSVWLHQFHRCVGLELPELHPVVFAFGVAGAVALPWKRLRRWTCAALLFLVVLATLGPTVAPRLQLERMAVAASCLAIVPAACWLRRVWNVRATGRAGIAATGLQAMTLALLILGATNAVRIYGSRGFAPFTGMRPSVRHLADWIHTNVPEDGRLLFAGLAVHAYGRGHVAYLPLLTGREMMACDYYGFPPGMVEMDYPPRAAKERGVPEFLRLHGVTHVITYHDRYIDYFRSLPDQFREVAHIDSEEKEDFTLFHVLDSGGRFREGTGTVRAGFNRWEVSFPDPPPETAVIAYNWHPRLHADPPAELFPQDTGQGATFIGIRPHGATHVRIRYRSRF